MNKITLIGRLTRDPEVKTGNATVVKFNLAVNRRFKKDGEQQADFIPCVAFGKTADVISQYVSKGNQLGVAGRLQINSYNDREGNRKWSTDVVVEEIDFCGSKGDRQASPSPAPNTPEAKDGFVPVDQSFEDDLPF